MHQLPLALGAAPRRAPFAASGETYDAKLDGPRLGRLLDRVRDALMSGDWMTLAELKAVAGGSETGISARLRELRHPVNGGYTIDRRRRGDPRQGLWEYALSDPNF